jgi:hypothetical protein
MKTLARERDTQEIIRRLRTLRSDSVRRWGGMSVSDLRRSAAAGRARPIFGRMSDAEWLRWGYLHTDHHRRQCERRGWLPLELLIRSVDI